jgi:hypothetical protein
MTLLDKLYVNIETQLGVSVPTGLVAWALELNWVVVLSCILITGQIGLLIPKYIEVYRKWKERRRGTKE